MKQLKIVEQIIIVLVLAVLIPFITIGIIISNISQQSVRSELANNTNLIAKFVADATKNYVEYSEAQLNQMASGFNYILDPMAKIQYFEDIETKTKLFSDLDVVEKANLPKEKYEITKDKITLYSQIDEQGEYYLLAKIKINIIDTLLGKENIKERNVYIFNSDTKELITTNASEDSAKNVLSDLVIREGFNSGLFGNTKNTPKAYYKISNPDWFVVVDTTTKITAKTITKAKYRIILSLIIAALSIIIIVSLYTYYLYINIRQLFKGITAISKGNYDKKIHLIKRAFTPHEIIFLAKEFNYMANKIKVSYKDLREKNKELEKLSEFRENLVNATSHEFRTPLTSIIGYSSRLLRNDIVVDDETKIKSLKIIKQQAQRLSNMVEDLLVIPELESYSLKYNIEEVDLSECIQRAIEYLECSEVKINYTISDDFNKMIFADNYRIEQILVNLIDNAQKYTVDNEDVKIEAKNDENGTPIVTIENKCEKINDEIKEKLFEKFIRADSKLTRTTRGTGLGLYIVKGLCEAMKTDIELECDDEFIITLKFNDYVK